MTEDKRLEAIREVFPPTNLSDEEKPAAEFLLSEIDRLKEDRDSWKSQSDKLLDKIRLLENECSDLADNESMEIKELEAENKELITRALERDKWYEKSINTEHKFVLVSKFLDAERLKVEELEAKLKELKAKD